MKLIFLITLWAVEVMIIDKLLIIMISWCCWKYNGNSLCFQIIPVDESYTVGNRNKKKKIQRNAKTCGTCEDFISIESLQCCFWLANVFCKTQSLWDLTMLLEVGKGGGLSASWGNDGSEWFSNLSEVKWLVQWHIWCKSSGKTRTASYLIFVFPVHAAQCQAHCGAWWMTLPSHIGWFAQDCEDKVITVWAGSVACCLLFPHLSFLSNVLLPQLLLPKGPSSELQSPWLQLIGPG